MQNEIVRQKVPAPLARPCEKPWRKAGGPTRTQDFVERGDDNEAKLKRCSAKVDRIIEWNAAP